MTVGVLDSVLRAGRAVIDGREQSASIGIAGGVIAAIGAADETMPAQHHFDVPDHLVVLPGLVDTHVHINEPGTDWEGFSTATAAAAAAGITTLVDMPLDSDPVTTNVAALERKRAAARVACRVDVGFWGGAVPENLDMLGELAAAGVLGFKCFLADSGNPRFGHLNAEQFGRAMATVAEIGSVMLVHAEDHAVIQAGPAAQGTYSSLLRARPEAAEVHAVNMVIDTVRRTGARAHIVHVSSAKVLPQIAAAKWAGLPVTAETCPHYLTFAADEIPDNATEFAVCPPIRRGANRQQLWSGLREGVLDMVVSDHSPCAPALKAGDFGRAFGGISSLELGPRAVWTRASMRGFGVPDLCRWMAQEPAALAGLTDRGRIALGCRADFALFDPDARATVSADTLSHRHPLTPYAGMSLRGRVVQTWLDGRPVDGRTHGALLSAVPTTTRKSA